MQTYINNLIDEKGIDREQTIEVSGQSGMNLIPVQVVLDAIINTSKAEQKAIRNTLVKIDFYNGDVMHYIRHLAQALAI